MASLVKKYDEKKLKGQIFTPFFIVNKILDDIGYSSENLLGKTILDPACGDGRFLIKIIERIIKFSPKKDLKNNLENIYGWDIDPIAIKLTLDNLNKIIAPYNIMVNWNINLKNSLKEQLNKKPEKFDFIVGNPPYIRIQHLEIQERKFIQENFNFCKTGATDIYIAFYELSLSLLKKNGIGGLITPNTFFYTETAKELRTYLVEHQHVRQITNFGSIQLFDDATTYSAIMIFDKKKHQKFKFQSAVNPNIFKERMIDYKEIKHSKFWQLSIPKIKTKKGKRLGDIAKIHVGITTLADKIYIMPFIKKEANYIYLQSKYNGIVKIEKNILKPIIKASTLKNPNESIKEFILFPYKKIDGKYQIIPENELKEKFPLAYQYLLTVKEILDKRDNGKPNKVAWYAFGRSQGLNTSFGEKILFSPMNKKPNFIYHTDKEATFYSGYCIKFDGDNEKLLKELNSSRMEKFIQISSRDFRGGWKAYNKKIVQEFTVNL